MKSESRPSAENGRKSIRATGGTRKFFKGSIQGLSDLAAHLEQGALFRSLMRRPFITVSYAQSLDGSIAARDRTQLLLSGSDSLKVTHHIRNLSDAIVIGINTVISDNPRLTVRLIDGEDPQPVVLDTHLRIPLGCRLVQRAQRPSWVASSMHNTDERRYALERVGVRVLPCELADDGKVDLFVLMARLADLGINSVMVEGGARVITSFVKARLVDQFIITVSPKLVGGLPVLNSPVLQGARCLCLDQVAYEPCGEDLIIWATPVWETE